MLNTFRKEGSCHSTWSLMTLLADMMAIKNTIFTVKRQREELGMGLNAFDNEL